MEPLPALGLALAGGSLGAAASMVPGLHVNTLAALGLIATAAGWLPGAPVAAFLLGALGAATFATIVPLVLLGVPDGEDAPALLPGQRLARAGLSRTALDASLRGSLIGLVAGAALALALARVLTVPDTWDSLRSATPWVAAATLVVLVTTDTGGALAATGVALLAGLLGLAAMALPVSSPLALPASALLPLFAGLFGLPALAMAARSRPAAGVDVTRRPRRAGTIGPLMGTALGGVAGVFAGFTAGPATAVAAQLRSGSDEQLIATTSAVNTAAACVATAVLHAVGRARSGVHAAQLALRTPTGTLDALALDLSLIAAGAVPAIFVLAGLRHPDRIAPFVPRIARALVVPWLLMIVAFTGWPGLMITAAGASVSRVAREAGTRRSMLMASLLLPALLRG